MKLYSIKYEARNAEIIVSETQKIHAPNESMAQIRLEYQLKKRGFFLTHLITIKEEPFKMTLSEAHNTLLRIFDNSNKPVEWIARINRLNVDARINIDTHKLELACHTMTKEEVFQQAQNMLNIAMRIES